MDFENLVQMINEIPPLKKHFFGILESKCQASAFVPPRTRGFAIFYSPAGNDQDDIGHFSCLFYQNKHVYFFDSYGIEPSKYGLKNVDDFNKVQVQPYGSCACSLFVLFFAYQALYIGAPNVVAKYFSAHSHLENQNIVYKWIRQFKPVSNSLKTCEA